MLYLVATPIGNLSDFSFRALETLKSCDYILCEDTRHSLILLKHYEIQKPLKSYHKFNEASQVDSILEDLQNGKIICLISDAGTPGISDPGEILVKKCVESQIPFSAIPGACAAIQALCCSGFPTRRFQFWGFLPKKEGELKSELQSIFAYGGTTICYESPHRILKVLEMIHLLYPDREIAIARELTKKFEEIVRGTGQTLLTYWETHPLKGEIVLMIGPNDKKADQEWEQWTPEEHVMWLQDSYGISKKDAIKIAAELRGVPKREIYQQVINTIH